MIRRGAVSWVLACMMASLTTTIGFAGDPPPPPEVSFIVSPPGGRAPLGVGISATIEGEVSYFWFELGDGSPPVYNDLSFGHTYTCPDTYVITLTAVGPGGTSSVDHSVTATRPTFSLTTLYYGGDPRAPAKARCRTNDDIRRSQIDWAIADWGDGSPPTVFTWVDLAQGYYGTPWHQYECSGAYTITVTNHYEDEYHNCEESASTSATLTRPIFSLEPFYSGGITVAPRNVLACTPDEVAMSPSAVDSAVVDWGDGSPVEEFTWTYGPYTGWRRTPWHFYVCPGSYTVTVTNYYEDDHNNSCEESASTVATLTPPDFQLDVVYRNGNTTAPADVRGWTDASHPYHHADWSRVDWGDGSPPEYFTWWFGPGCSGCAWHYFTPWHTYVCPGDYSITITNHYGGDAPGCEDLAQAAANIGGDPAAAFSFEYVPPEEMGSPVVRFFDTSSGNPNSWLWDFGDGTTSIEQHPTHAFPGGCIDEYGVVLEVWSEGAGECRDSESQIVGVSCTATYPRPKALVVSGYDPVGQLDEKLFWSMWNLIGRGWETVPISEATRAEVCAALADPSVRGLYINGHGAYNCPSGPGCMVLSDGAGGKDYVYPADIGPCLGGRRLDFVTVIGCDQDWSQWLEPLNVPPLHLAMAARRLPDGSVLTLVENAFARDGHGNSWPLCYGGTPCPTKDAPRAKMEPAEHERTDQGCYSFEVCDSSGCGSDLFPVWSCGDSVGLPSSGQFGIWALDGSFSVTVFLPVEYDDTVACAATYLASVPDPLRYPLGTAIGRFLCFADAEVDTTVEPDSLVVRMRYEEDDLERAGIADESGLRVCWLAGDASDFSTINGVLDTVGNNVTFSVSGWGLAGIYDLGGITNVREDEGVAVSLEEVLEVHPNPIAGGTAVRFSLAETVVVRLGVFDCSGRMVRALEDAVRGPGAHEVSWDGKDDAGRSVPSGTYFARLHAGEYVAVRKMVLLR
ncbi:MAG: hypothetical protein FJY88_08960 [Candidatus Eisenbacteria bacterium]|nr:hypothetical protein [Candidatus Eisenbacteria bacterium]